MSLQLSCAKLEPLHEVGDAAFRPTAALRLAHAVDRPSHVRPIVVRGYRVRFSRVLGSLRRVSTLDFPFTFDIEYRDRPLFDRMRAILALFLRLRRRSAPNTALTRATRHNT